MKKLTGRTRFRAAETINLGLAPSPALVWQVETVHTVLKGTILTNEYGWRDGSVEDLCEINHIVYSNINVTVHVEQPDAVPGEKSDARKFH